MIGIRWTGADESRWDLRRGNVRLTDGGIQGLGMLAYQGYTQDTAQRDGQYATGWKGLPRDILLPVKIGHSQMSEQDFLDVEAAWYQTMRPDEEGTLTVTAANGDARTIQARFVDDGGVSLTRDPTRDRTVVVPFRLVADDPWWLGTPFKDTFGTDQVGTPRNFFGGGPVNESGKGPLFVLGKSTSNSQRSLTNHGQVAVWPVYTVIGPAAFRFEVAGGVIERTVPVPQGYKLVIDTSPLRQTVRLYAPDGTYVNAIKTMSRLEFRSIPKGGTVEAKLEISGAGSVEVTGIPRYFKAWG
jgi:hypothetical protein